MQCPHDDKDDEGTAAEDQKDRYRIQCMAVIMCQWVCNVAARDLLSSSVVVRRCCLFYQTRKGLS